MSGSCWVSSRVREEMLCGSPAGQRSSLTRSKSLKLKSAAWRSNTGASLRVFHRGAWRARARRRGRKRGMTPLSGDELCSPSRKTKLWFGWASRYQAVSRGLSMSHQLPVSVAFPTAPALSRPGGTMTKVCRFQDVAKYVLLLPSR